MHWNWTLVLAGVGSVGGFGLLVLAVGSTITRRIKVVQDQNTRQLAKQEKFEREWFGEDPDYPGGPRRPGMVERVANIERNTQTLPDRVASAESRLGKLEDRFDLLEDVVLRRPPGGN